MEKKRIIDYSWNIPKGGLPKVMMKEYHYLLKLGYDVSLATSDVVPDSYKDEMKNENVNILFDKDREITAKKTDISHYFPGLNLMVNGGFISRMVKLTLYLKSQKAEIVIVHQLLSAILTLPFRLLFRKPYILILHDNPFSFIESSNYEKMSVTKKITSHFVYYLCILGIRLSKITICTTKFIENNLKEHISQTEKIIVVDYGLDYFPEEIKEVRELILTVSKWSNFRNPSAYLNLLRYLPKEIVLTMVGRWDTKKELDDFRNEVIKNELQKRIVIMENVSETELAHLYKKTKVFIRLGFNEHGTGQAILEAISYGCPVVISKGLGASEFIIDGKEGFLVDENNLQVVSERIMHIYNSEQLVTKMSEASQNLVLKNSWENYLSKIHDVIL